MVKLIILEIYRKHFDLQLTRMFKHAQNLYLIIQKWIKVESFLVHDILIKLFNCANKTNCILVNSLKSRKLDVTNKPIT